MSLDSSDFSAFFRTIHGYKPFPWQQKLVDILARSDEWPEVLELPTGTGKTAALDAAVFHLALRADTPGKAALRIALVVDRRLVVDDTFSRARKIADALACASGGDAEGGGAIEEVARRLKRLAGEKKPPLVAQRLRGGAPLEHDWALTPTQPTILCSTVDQVGSRLLFRGYGVSDRMKPVHAGLLGVNSLILLDEAHLSEPFRQTVDSVRKLGNAKVALAVLSATPGAKPGRRFTLSKQDRADAELKKRLNAEKAVALKPPVRKQTGTNAMAFVNEAWTLMERLRGQGASTSAVGVIVNRVALARAIYKKLTEKLAEVPVQGDEVDARDIDVILLIGPSRSVDRADVVNKLAPLRTGAGCRAEAKSLFVVATQCLEVGVDLDLDGLVTQAASLDALRQRFGRLNRAGRSVKAQGTILAAAEDVAKKADDPVYGDRIRVTWEALGKIADDSTVDFGVEALPMRLKMAGIEPNDLAATRPDAPVVMPSYLDLWSQTSPRPAADPEVSLFLHGAERTTAGVSIVWRSDIFESDLTEANEADLKELIQLVPARTAEAVEVPLRAARAWLSQAEDSSANISDAPEREAKERWMARNQGNGRRAFRWAGPDDLRTGVVGADGLRTGDLLVVPSGYGGCDRFGWAPDCKELVADVADEAAAPYRGRRLALRVAPDIVRRDDQWDRVAAVLASGRAGGVELVDALLAALRTTEEGIRDARPSLEALRRPKGRIDVHLPYAGDRAKGMVLVAERGVEHPEVLDTAVPATEHETASHTSSAPVRLDDHGRRVAGLAERFARTLGLEAVADDLRLAAFLHDAGKADPRFQIMLSGGDPWNRHDGPPLAKSAQSWSPGARARAGLPAGWRHEALSVRMARVHPRLDEARDRALVLWLIGTHHGFGRPFFNFVDPCPEHPLACLNVADWRLLEEEAGPQSLAFDLDGEDWPSLFECLKQRYGIWGIAHLEAILRLADHRASEEERKL